MSRPGRPASARKASAPAPIASAASARPQEWLARILMKEIGAGENPLGSNRGSALTKFFEADNLVIGGKTDGYAWCASFVSWGVQEWLRLLGAGAPRIQPPRLARAYAFEDWGADNNCMVLAPTLSTKILPGDIITYVFSHVGVATSEGTAEFLAVEGNTAKDGGREGHLVAVQRRTLKQVRRIIRLPARARTQ
jgi:hypothetical protein